MHCVLIILYVSPRQLFSNEVKVSSCTTDQFDYQYTQPIFRLYSIHSFMLTVVVGSCKAGGHFLFLLLHVLFIIAYLSILCPYSSL